VAEGCCNRPAACAPPVTEIVEHFPKATMPVPIGQRSREFANALFAIHRIIPVKALSCLSF
jgi:hypothetical protein